MLTILGCVEPCFVYVVRGDWQTKQRILEMRLRECMHFYFYHTLLCNHVPLQGWLIGAHEYEAHHVFDIWYRNTSDIVPTAAAHEVRSERKRESPGADQEDVAGGVAPHPSELRQSLNAIRCSILPCQILCHRKAYAALLHG